MDTIKKLFEGSEELFPDLYIHGQWDWSVGHPVVRFDFAYGSFTEPGSVHANLTANSTRASGGPNDGSPSPVEASGVEEAHPPP